MLELLGSGYVIDHCISAFKKAEEEKAFRCYVADGLFALVTKSVSLSSRYIDIIEPKSDEQIQKEKIENHKKSEKVISNLRAKLKG